MAISITSAKNSAITSIRRAIDRSLVLHKRAVLNGGTLSEDNIFSPFSNPDKRDLTVFIFFETAASFEYFAEQTFILAVRKRYSVQPQFATFLGGNIDRGMGGVMGWSASTQIVKRARNAFGKQHFLSKLHSDLPGNHYEWLNHAHRVRNRIAHPGNQARAQVNNLLGALSVPPSARQGLSMGRLLAEYPAGNPSDDRWFHRFLAAYSSYVDLVARKL